MKDDSFSSTKDLRVWPCSCYWVPTGVGPIMRGSRMLTKSNLRVELIATVGFALKAFARFTPELAGLVLCSTSLSAAIPQPTLLGPADLTINVAPQNVS